MKKKFTSFMAILIFALITFSGMTAVAAINKQQQIIMEPQQGTVSVSGNVYGFPLNGTGPQILAGAEVYIGGGRLKNGLVFAFKSTTTDQNGYYQFEDMPIGTYLILARKPPNYLPGFRLLILTENNPVKHNVDVYLLHKLFGGNQQLMMLGLSLIPEGQDVSFEDPYECMCI